MQSFLVRGVLAAFLSANLFLGGLACTGEEASRVGGVPPTPEDLRAGARAKTAEGEPRLRTPAGFRVTYFARNLPAARFMALGPDGSVYVSQIWLGQVTRLIDANRDGVAELATPILTGLDLPHGLVVRKGYLYIANTGGVVRVRLGRDGNPAGGVEQINSYSPLGGHVTRTIVFGRDGSMYVSIGSTCNICVEQTPDRAAVMRYDEDGKNGSVYASGLRNAVGLAVHPVTGKVWATQNERDNLLPDWQDLPPEEINILQKGGDYGWPYLPRLVESRRAGRTTYRAHSHGTVPARRSVGFHYRLAGG
jgi:glucose/arabinose dehydrogenase